MRCMFVSYLLFACLLACVATTHRGDLILYTRIFSIGLDTTVTSHKQQCISAHRFPIHLFRCLIMSTTKIKIKLRITTRCAGNSQWTSSTKDGQCSMSPSWNKKHIIWYSEWHYHNVSSNNYSSHWPVRDVQNPRVYYVSADEASQHRTSLCLDITKRKG